MLEETFASITKPAGNKNLAGLTLYEGKLFHARSLRRKLLRTHSFIPSSIDYRNEM
jgi:hypothetical protein